MTKETYRLDGAKVRSFRRATKGWGRDKLREVTGLSLDTIIDIERGRRSDGRPVRVHSETVDVLATALGVSHNELLLQEGKDPTEEVPVGFRDHLCSFDAFIEDRTEGFVGREFVFQAIDRFVASVGSGYFVIRGEPGIGKSALVARLVQTQDCIHHFNIALQGINTTSLFLRNICAQLITRHHLPYTALPDDATRNGSFFNKVLCEAQSKQKKDAPILLAIDALDEVNLEGHPASANVVFLPPSLPGGVYAVVTTRPLHDCRLQVSTPSGLELEKNSEGQIADVRLYVQAYLSNQEVRAWMRPHGLTDEGFIDLMLDKSERNFMYLRYVLPAIAEGRFKDFGIQSLPEGLAAYYRGHWTLMKSRDPQIFEQVYQPVVCVLAAVKRAVSPEEVAEWTKVDGAKVREVIREWRQFLYEERDQKGQACYRVYHASFQEFLQGEVDPGLRTYHRMIGQSVLKKAGKLGRPAKP